MIVAGHFEIASTAKRPCISRSGEDDSAFPVVRGQLCPAGKLLGCERSFRFERDAQFRDRDAPVDWIHRPSERACPFFSNGFQREII